ncbi:biopolymer transporter ExbD [Terrimonas sp.]|uniref:ExbD/TolR family protein n=1 Tax=Terrimonas sp. TaxID=1914338 RepID=UPI000D51118F|nr:biopolymer transporter ExbD [Terrimonas sp.]PVD50049.1 biopolymer transporter ExbD [Terrimonas sp.]
MADINTTPASKSTTTNQRHSTRVDMTPMVDLGFLLITFFIFTSVVAKPAALKFLLPAEGSPTPVPKTKTITILPDDNNSIICYEGIANEQPVIHHFKTSDNGLRNFIMDKRKRMSNAGISPDSLIVVIKPGDGSDYGQLMNVLDEMAICEVKRHALASRDVYDKELLIAGH